eukprot:gene9364-11099_t
MEDEKTYEFRAILPEATSGGAHGRLVRLVTVDGPTKDRLVRLVTVDGPTKGRLISTIIPLRTIVLRRKVVVPCGVNEKDVLKAKVAACVQVPIKDPTGAGLGKADEIITFQGSVNLRYVYTFFRCFGMILTFGVYRMLREEWQRLLKLSRSEWKWIALGLFTLALRLPFSLSMPHFISVATAASVKHESTDKIVSNIKYFFIAASINSGLDFFNFTAFVVAQQRLIRKLRNMLFRSLTRQEMAFFDKESTGDLLSRLTSDCGEMANDLTWVFRWSLEAIVRLSGISIYLFFVSWKIALVTWSLVPVIAWINSVYGRWMHKNAKKVQSALAGANEVSFPSLSATPPPGATTRYHYPVPPPSATTRYHYP